ncbi:hypothetical protein ABZ820_22145 [Streptomyces diacarni]|uniref:hypothetical protein n=1 Tax=Streptomyces diacarni TaxID=2800381 RepID=UPI0033F138C4
MNATPMPEPLRRAVHHLVAEAVSNCQEVLRYTEPDVASRWQRMTLYRATDAADTLDMAAMLIAAYCQRTGMAADTLSSYLQTSQQKHRVAGPQDEDRAELAGLLGEASSPVDDEMTGLRFAEGQQHAKTAERAEDDPQALFTEACLHGLRARLCDDLDSLDRYLPPHTAAMARKVADALKMSEPVTV